MLRITSIDWCQYRHRVFNTFPSYLTRLTLLKRDLSRYVTGEFPYTINLYRSQVAIYANSESNENREEDLRKFSVWWNNFLNIVMNSENYMQFLVVLNGIFIIIELIGAVSWTGFWSIYGSVKYWRWNSSDQ
jgi:hypothetical protein